MLTTLPDFGDDEWLLIAEWEGHDGLGQVLGYMACPSEEEAWYNHNGHYGDWMDVLGYRESPPSCFGFEVMTYADFKASYGNRMPLNNRIKPFYSSRG